MEFSNREAKRPLPKPIPERIKEAREARGFTLDSFASALGVTRQAIAQFETGLTTPSGETMSRIIGETDQPLSFFLATPPRSGIPKTPFWRSLKRMELHHRRRILRRLQWAADVMVLIERFIEVPPVNLPSIDFDPNTAGSEEIEKAAEDLRTFWKLGVGPVLNVGGIAEQNGVVLIREPVGCPDMDAVSAWIAGRPFVLLSSEVSSGPRDAFNLVHEIGHILLHASVDVSSSNIDLLERQANRFASAFLLPRASFSREVLGTSIEYFKSLKRRWGVSIAGMAYRCKDLDILNENQLSYVYRQMNTLKIRKSEPLDSVVLPSMPSILGDSVKMLVEYAVFTRDQIATALGLNMSDVESLCGIPPGYLNTRVVRVQFRPKTNDNEHIA